MIVVPIITSISAGLILAGVIYQLSGTLGKKEKRVLSKRDIADPKYCVLIPARYESKVIKGLLESISKQTHKINMQDVYVIVESLKDETVKIAKDYNATVFLRTNLKSKSKGYALDECIKDILGKKKSYDAYFIFDADNILDKNFVSEMDGLYHDGYDAVLGYRNTKNGNDNVIAACSSLTFSMINTIGNNHKIKRNRNIVFSGSGFFVNGKIIEKLKGFPFVCLTEDYELSLYLTLHNYCTFYSEKAIFYDEQPVTMRQSVTQRTRWIRGYFDSRKIFIPKIRAEYKRTKNNTGGKRSFINGVKPIIVIVIGIILYLFAYLVSMFVGVAISTDLLISCAIGFGVFAILVYLILVGVTAAMLVLEKNKINLSKKMKRKALFYNPIFLITYIPCALKALSRKELEWERIDHSVAGIK